MGEQHVEFAVSRGRVICTHDADLVRLHQAGVPQTGIVNSARGAGQSARFCVISA
jgi:hypothetical protein